MKVTYIIDGALIDVLRVVAEVKAITGMAPEEIETTDSKIIKFSDRDYQLLENSHISELIYIKKNLKFN